MHCEQTVAKMAEENLLRQALALGEPENRSLRRFRLSFRLGRAASLKS